MNDSRSEPFVPLGRGPAGSQARGELCVTVVSQAENVQPFQLLGAKPAGATAPVASPECEPRISLQRDGDRVASIHIECTCGRVIELACVY